ncbi:CPBP family intramembrane metalloprotease [bacterium]|nr:CPBP family intramembrane metalloprotease [candidate division CSSED10-310 bacterium]
MIPKLSKFWLWVEFTGAFIILPFVLFMFRYRLRRMVIPLLLIGLIVFLGLLWRDPSFDRRRFGLPDGWMSHVRAIISRLILGGTLVMFIVRLAEPHLMFSFIRNAPKIWIVVMILYPLVSVYPQEIIYRAFFFHRYSCLFLRPWQMIVASGLSFGLVHIFFFNPWAIGLSCIGGILFAATYHRSGSIVLSTIEHGLWGDFIFTVGIGAYFYSGAIG